MCIDIYDFTGCYFGRSFTRPDTDVTVLVTNSTATFYQDHRLASGVQTSHCTCVPDSFYRSRSSLRPPRLSPLNTFGYAALL